MARHRIAELYMGTGAAGIGRYPLSMSTNTLEWLPGGCHCGAVRFRVRARTREALACNCSMCAKKGMLNFIVTAEDFELTQGEAMLETYTFHTHVARHRFCRRCGIHPFSHPRSHPEGIDVNLRCLDDGRAAEFTITVFDGQHWEAAVASIR